MNWGVLPVLYDGEPGDELRIDFAIEKVREIVNAGEGDILVVTSGHLQQRGGTDLVRIITL